MLWLFTKSWLNAEKKLWCFVRIVCTACAETTCSAERRAMEKHPQPFDVCIVCALPEEARAFLEVVQPQCESAIEERTSPRYHYSYRFATIKNDEAREKALIVDPDDNIIIVFWSTMSDLASLYRARGKYEQAGLLYEHALSLYKQQSGRDHSYARTIRKNYARFLRAIGRDEEANRLEES